MELHPAKGTGWYNGYSWTERAAKLKELYRKIARKEVAPPTGPCDLCGDPEVKVEHHDEDYSVPYIWSKPALFCLCRNCHRDKLHKRFARPQTWFVFLAHVRRGGYARDLVKPKDLSNSPLLNEYKAITKELKAYKVALESGRPSELRQLRPYLGVVGEEWFARVSMDAASLTGPSARPRP
jgi:hypothetical protein